MTTPPWWRWCTASPTSGRCRTRAALVATARRARPEARVVIDAGETAGLVPVDAMGWGADAVPIGGGSVGAPPWVGALAVRPGARLHPMIEGGLQEGGKRAGAENLPAIVGLGAAAEIAVAEMDERATRMRALSDRLLAGLLAVPDVRLNGPREARIPGHVQVSAGWVEGETLTLALAERGRGRLARLGVHGPRRQGRAGARGDRPGAALDPLGRALHAARLHHGGGGEPGGRRVRRIGGGPARHQPAGAVSARIVDALGTWCPVPIHLIDRAARRAEPGEVIELLADDPLIEVNLPAWCHSSGNDLLELRREGTEYVGRVEVTSRGRDGRGPRRDPAPGRSASG